MDFVTIIPHVNLNIVAEVYKWKYDYYRPISNEVFLPFLEILKSQTSLKHWLGLGTTD